MTDVSDDSETVTIYTSEETELVQPDEDFYRDDGDCIIRVENTLFRIHKFLLTRDSLVFSDMFRLPQEAAKGVNDSAPSQGKSDDNPILLPGDSAQKFRALCWALYALPTDLCKKCSDDNDVLRLLDVAEMAHKYNFESFETWSLSIIYKLCMEKKKAKSKFLNACPTEILSRLLHFATISDKKDLSDAIQQAWIIRLTPSAEMEELIAAVNISEQLGLRKLMGQAYYRLLIMMNASHPSNPSELCGPVKFSSLISIYLSHEQTHRLLAGHWSLSLCWERIRRSGSNGVLLPTSIPASVRIEAWTWASRHVGGASIDVISSLRSVRREIGTFRWTQGREMLIASEAIDNIIMSLEESLSDHFLSQE